MEMKLYQGTKQVFATPMTREDYQNYCGHPVDPLAKEDGYLVEYLDGGKSNHPNHSGYISWSPKDVFERSYRHIEKTTPNNVIDFSQMVAALAKDGELILKELTPQDADLLHMGVGVSGEAGELLDAIKKATIYRKPLDLENIIEELGDLEFYMERVRQIVGVTRQQTIDANIAKLGKRYSSGTYSNDQAKERADKVAS